MRSFTILFLSLLPICGYSQDRYLVDWDTVGEQTIQHLVDLIQIDTSNPPGNETKAADYLRAVLASEGIDSQLYALDPERANLVARIKGNGSKRPILIMAHTDVVGVQRDRWSEDPFGGIRKDGYVYGRGTLDDKDNVTAGLMVMLMLKRFEVKLDRDIIFLAEAGEEGTPQVGITYMIEKHWNAIDAEFCLAELGGGILEGGVVKTVSIQAAEKIARRATLVARGTAGHGSMPLPDNAVALLASAVAKAAAWKTEMRLNDITRMYFERMATIADAQDAWRFRNIGVAGETDAIQQHFMETFPYHYSVLRTSVVPTIMKAGFRNNVIPSEATAVLDIRMLPDEDVAAFYQLLADVIDDPRVEIVPEPIYRPAAGPSPIDSEMFHSLEKVANRMYPDAVVLPVMSTAATDMAMVRAKGMAAYGIGPVSTKEDLTGGRGLHGDDERIAEASMQQFVQFLWYTIIDIAATK
jgi:acetylornithine deacetylase/succinyl-diaminopimelate desuccinylase-like protein